MTNKGKTSRLSEQFTFCWSQNLELRLRTILKEFRRASKREDVSTPELLALARMHERFLESNTLNRILLALTDHQPPLLDCDLLAQLDRLKNRISNV